MATFIVHGYATCSVTAEVEAESIEAAKLKVENLSPPTVHTDFYAVLDNGHWHFNEFDDPPEDALLDIIEQSDGGGS